MATLNDFLAMMWTDQRKKYICWKCRIAMLKLTKYNTKRMRMDVCRRHLTRSLRRHKGIKEIKIEICKVMCNKIINEVIFYILLIYNFEC